jgi:8-hydroxy-5-deazaflavin:NADPH oxidoreductase
VFDQIRRIGSAAKGVDKMRVGILGTGDVARALGNGFVELGHEVRMGARSATNEKSLEWVKSAGPRASPGTFEDAAAFGEVVLLCTKGTANENAIALAKQENFDGKVVIDTTNPLDFSGGMPPKLAISGNDSGGEQVQRLLPKAGVVKAFNIVGNAYMFRPDFPGGPPDMFICGNDAEAKKKVTGILKDFGWPTIDIGGIEGSRYLEAMCIVWVIAGARGGNWNQAFKMLRK